jgi:hypothetical protein
MAKGKAGPPPGGWWWVLTTPVTERRDNMLVLEVEGGRGFVPVFASRGEAERVLSRLAAQSFRAQAMHEEDVKKFAASGSFGVRVVDGEGRVAAVWENPWPGGGAA